MFHKGSFISVLSIAALAIMLLPAVALAEGNLVSFGFGGGSSFDSEGAVGFAEFERLLSDRLGLAFRAGVLDYEYDDGDNLEEGDGPGVEAAVRFYLGGTAPEGFYLGGGLGVWFTEWTYIDDYPYSYRRAGSGDSTSLEVHFALGAHFAVADKVMLTPAFQIGSFISSDSELGPYMLLGASVGFMI
jgi:hypothetical protein